MYVGSLSGFYTYGMMLNLLKKTRNISNNMPPCVQINCGSMDLYINKHNHIQPTNSKSHIKQLSIKRKILRDNMEMHIGLALLHCNPRKVLLHNDNQSCLAIWNEIESITQALVNVDKELYAITEILD